MDYIVRAVAILNRYRYAKMVLSGDMSQESHPSFVRFIADRSKNAQSSGDSTGNKVVYQEELRSFVARVDAIMSQWDDEDREIIRRKYLDGEGFVDNKEVLKSLKRDGYRLTQDRFDNARKGALANLAALIKEVA